MNSQENNKQVKRYPQTNIRFNAEDRERIERIAVGLHKQGVPGMVDRHFRPRTTELLRYLLEREDERLMTESEEES